MSRIQQTQLITLTLLVAAGAGLLLARHADLHTAMIGIVFILTIGFSYQYPRHALWAFLIYMPFAGTITYRSGGDPLTFHAFKDTFYIPALIALIQDLRQQRKPPPIPKVLVVPLFLLLGSALLTFFFLNVVQHFSGTSHDDLLLIGVTGLKVLLGYIPLMVCGYYLIRDKQDLFFLIRLHVILALICCFLGFIQYQLLVSGVCPGTRGLKGEALLRATLEAKCFIGGSLVFTPEIGIIRLPGTFVAPWQWGWFLISNAFITFAGAISDRSRPWKIASFAAMLAVLVMALVSGQRIALVLVPMTFAILLLINGWVEGRSLSSVRKPLILVLIGLICFIGIGSLTHSDLVQQRVDNFVNRWQVAPPHEFIATQYQWVDRQSNGILGNGLGRGTNAARFFGRTKLIETFYPKLLYEMGFLGLLSFLSVVTILSLLTFKAYRGVKSPHLRVWGLCMWIFILFISYNTYYYPLDVDPVAVYYWFFAGVILKLPELDTQEEGKSGTREREVRNVFQGNKSE